MKKHLLTTLTIFMILISACKKDAPDFTGYKLISETTPGSDDGPDTETGLIVTVDPSYNYQPVSAGSYWKRASSGDLQEPDTTEEVMLGTTVTFSGRSYHVGSRVIKSADAPGTVNFHHSGDVYSVREVEADGTFSEFIYLKADLAVGQEWDAGALNPVNNVKIVGKIMEKGITKTVKGKTFKDVIHTKIDFMVSDGGGGYVTAVVSDYYIAKGVGVIEADGTISGITVKTQLYDFLIN